HARSLQELGESVLQFALSLVPKAQAGSVLLLNEFLERYEFVAAVGWDLHKLRALSFPKDELIQHRIYKDKPAIIRNILELDRAFWGPEVVEKLAEVGSVAATLTLPLWAGEKLIGYLNLDHPTDPEAFAEEDLHHVSAYQDILASLLEQGRKVEELRENASLFRLLFERLADAVYIVAFDGTILEANPAAERQTGCSRAELLGKNIMRDIAADEPAITYEKANELLARGETVVFEEKKRRKDGSIYWTECAVVQFVYKGKPATLSVNRDITHRKRLEEELAQKVEELSALNRAVAALTSQLERRKVIQALVDLARSLTQAEYVNVILFDAEGNVLETIDPFGAPPLPLRMRPRGFTRLILSTGKPLLIAEIKPDGTCIPEVRDQDGLVLAANPVLVEAGVRSLAGFPVRIRGKVRGVFYVHSKKPGALSPFVSALEILARHAEIALENAELYEQLRESEARHRTLFQESPISLWIEDFSQVKLKLDELRAGGVKDLRAYLAEHPDFLCQTLGLLRVVEVNLATLKLYEVQSPAELLRHLPTLIPEEVWPLWQEELLAIWEGHREFYGRGINRTARGRKLHIFLGWRVLPGHEGSYARVLVSVLDLTAQVEAEEALQRVNAAITALSSTLDLPALLHRIYDEAQKLVPFDAFFVMHADKRRGRLVPLFAVERGKPLALPEIPLDAEKSSTAWVALHKEPLFLEDVERTPPPVPFQRVGESVRAWVGLPLVAQDEVIGVLSVQSFAPQRFGERERMVLLALAAGAAVALRNALLHQQIRNTAAKLRAIGEISRRMKLAQTPAELYNLVLSAVAEVFGFAYAAILEAQDDALVVVAHHGYPPELQNLRLPFAEKRGVTVASYLANEPIYVPDVREEPRYVAGLPAMGCELAIPISVGEQKFGVLNVEHPEIDGISPEDRDLLQILAAELAVALSGARYLRQLQTLGAKLMILHEISQRLQRATTVQEVCELTVQAMAERLGFDHVNLGLGQGDVLVPVASAGVFAGKARPLKRAEGLAGKTWALGKTFYGNVEDFPEGKPVDPRIRAVISVPIGDKGVIQVIATRPNAFTKDDVTVVEILARHVYEELRRVELEEELREQAIRDPVTGLYNRRFLDEVLRREVARAERYGHALSLILIDINNFKAINDRYGHLVGDEALRRVAKALRENIRRVDYIFRWGG
ncbi:MAG: GAF domain-containing protein, partial [Candidatus Bipolaricaulaceae bacterium]